jgi:DHA1 family tetracycline resistance protein-like MFS transporter
MGFALAAATYPFVPDLILVVPLVLIEGTSFAMIAPSFFALVASASPPGRSATAQGIAGAAGTFGTITASVATGLLAAIDPDLPFFAASAVAGASVVVGLLVGGRRLVAVTSRRESSQAVAAP